jgi:hypothetical protein
VTRPVGEQVDRAMRVGMESFAYLIGAPFLLIGFAVLGVRWLWRRVTR